MQSKQQGTVAQQYRTFRTTGDNKQENHKTPNGSREEFKQKQTSRTGMRKVHRQHKLKAEHDGKRKGRNVHNTSSKDTNKGRNKLAWTSCNRLRDKLRQRQSKSSTRTYMHAQHPAEKYTNSSRSTPDNCPIPANKNLTETSQRMRSKRQSGLQPKIQLQDQMG